MVRSIVFHSHSWVCSSWEPASKPLLLVYCYGGLAARRVFVLDGDQPATGRWNYDDENRQRPPKSATPWPDPQVSRLDDGDRAVLADLPDDCWGAEPDGTWATSRRAALARLRHFVDEALPMFGPHEDARVERSWHLAHSVLSPYLNIGLLLPGEVCDAVEARYRAGEVPINSAEGFIRQVIGWREYVWGLYWLWPELADGNALDHDRPLPPAFSGEGTTQMRCLADALDGLERRAWVHHIPRLMVLSNLANLVGIEPRLVYRWMLDRYIDGAEWVMVPNVMGMGLWADGGRMASKPYISGGAYIDRMSDYCGTCPYDPRKRTGEDACPFTTLYWDFLARHEARLRGNHRLSRPLAGMRRLKDLPAVRARAREVRDGIEQGRL